MKDRLEITSTDKLFETRQFHANEKEAGRLYFGLVVKAELEMSNSYDSLLVLPLSFIDYLRLCSPGFLEGKLCCI